MENSFIENNTQFNFFGVVENLEFFFMFSEKVLIT